MTRKIYIVPIEPIDTRYTRQWYEHIPLIIDRAAKSRNLNIDVIIVDGEQVPPIPTPGAFLDFGATNIYKSSQLGAIAHDFQHGKINDGDVFLFTDAWNPTVISVKYMAELLGKKIKIHCMWHAGSYDPQDFLGRLIGNQNWVRHAEKSMFYSYDTNWFATDFHLDMFIQEIFCDDAIDVGPLRLTSIKEKLLTENRVGLTGWPMDYLTALLEPYSKITKRPKITFPHRIAPEKQLAIFQDLAKHMPEYEWTVCQEKQLSKHDYHTILGESMLVFSANLQETFGISCIEGLLCDSFPLVPDRLSYAEMWDNEFRYPGQWTQDWDSYLKYRHLLMERIRTTINLYHDRPRELQHIKKLQRTKIDSYIRADRLVNALLT